MRKFKVYETSRDFETKLHAILEGSFGSETSLEKAHKKVTVNPNLKYQKILGFGGGLTESACYTISKLGSKNKEKLLNAYFDKVEGHRYNIGRVHINSCDFSLENYSYVADMDVDLNTFSIEREKKYTIPLIIEAQEKLGENLILLASPWSPPSWMKSNGHMNNGGKLIDMYKPTWAKYYSKFIDAYKKEGLKIWGITVQNEPEAVQTWDSCIYTAEEERDFIKYHLGPQLNIDGYSDVKILIWDHNRDLMVKRVEPIYRDQEASKYVWGTGFHWYVSEDFSKVGEVYSRWPSKHLLFTEGCQEGGVQLGSWDTGERYGRNIIGDFNNGNEGFLDWNIVLDEDGGPNHVGNYCDAPIIADTKKDILHFNSSYYYIGHFSRFIDNGAYRLQLIGDYKTTEVCAFENEDGSITIVILNETDIECSWEISLEEGSTVIKVRPHSIITMKIN